MQFEHTTWSVEHLLDLIQQGKIDLQPEYQRNPVWRSSSQIKLIESIIQNRPIPSFFIRKLGADRYEMVDGQQRARTIVAYWKNLIPGVDNKYLEQRLRTEGDPTAFRNRYLTYNFPVTIITAMGPDERIQDYYVLLNNSSLRLNRPELKKAAYYNTRFLNLIKTATDYPPFRDLDLFNDYSLQRMSDFESVSELIATIKYGIFDKKEKVDQLFEDDVNDAEESALFEDFARLIDRLNVLDRIQRLKRTRLKQKADFYTFTYFLHTLGEIQVGSASAVYKAFVKIAPHIRPSNSRCEPLREYAHHCVTQSNSKSARQTRHEILSDLLANADLEPNKRQRQVLDFFKAPHDSIVRFDGYTILKAEALKDPTQKELDLNAIEDDEL